MKEEAGLDHYELTKYRGWYNPITPSRLALAFLKAVQREWGKNVLATVPEIRWLLAVVLSRMAWNLQGVIAWFTKRKETEQREILKVP